MISRFILEAINAIDPNTSADVTRNDTDTIRFFQNPSNITVEQVIAKIPEVEADYNAKAYRRERQYPPIREQLDLQYWDKKNGTKKWEEAIDKVKADHPKG